MKVMGFPDMINFQSDYLLDIEDLLKDNGKTMDRRHICFKWLKDLSSDPTTYRNQTFVSEVTGKESVLGTKFMEAEPEMYLSHIKSNC